MACGGTRWLLRLTQSHATMTGRVLTYVNVSKVRKQIFEAFGVSGFYRGDALFEMKRI